MMEDPDGRRVTGILYEGGWPFSVFASGAVYDFDFCEDGTLAYHLSGLGFGLGFGLSGNSETWLWALSPRRYGKKLARLGIKLLEVPVMRDGRMNPFEFDNATEGTTVYCRVCKARMLDEEWCVCEHLEWCEDCAVMGGMGAEDGCDCWKGGGNE